MMAPAGRALRLLHSSAYIGAHYRLALFLFWIFPPIFALIRYAPAESRMTAGLESLTLWKPDRRLGGALASMLLASSMAYTVRLAAMPNDGTNTSALLMPPSLLRLLHLCLDRGREHHADMQAVYPTRDPASAYGAL